MRATVVFVAALLVVGAGAPFAAAASAADAPTAATAGSVDVQDDDATNETENETAPGARLAGVAEVQGAEVEGEVEQRSFGLQIAAATSNASKASVVADQTRTLETRLATLQERKTELEAARENGTISESRFRAEMAGLAARISTLQRLTNATAETAKGLPADALADRGVNASAVERLRSSANNLSGPEVAAIAREIAGPTNGSVGPPENAGDGPPFGPNSEDNRTTGAPDDTPGDANRTTGAPDSTPVGQNATTGTRANATTGDRANVTTGGPGDVSPGTNATTGNGTGVNRTVTNGSGAPGSGTGADAPMGNGTNPPGNGTSAGPMASLGWNAATVDWL